MAGKAFWYKLLDALHYARINLDRPHRGFIVLNKHDWAHCFYRDGNSQPSERAWERWKVDLYREGLMAALPGDEEIPTSVTQVRVVVHERTANDAIYFALGSPHPDGVDAQAVCEKKRQDDLMPTVVRGIAAAVRVEQRRRHAG